MGGAKHQELLVTVHTQGVHSAFPILVMELCQNVLIYLIIVVSNLFIYLP